MTGGVLPKLKQESDMLLIEYGEQSIPVSLDCPEFEFSVGTLGSGVKPLTVNGSIQSGELVVVSFATMAMADSNRLEVKLFLQWSPEEAILRKWVRFRLNGASPSLVLKELILERIDARDSRIEMCATEFPYYPKGQSYPAFLEGFFVGVEFPIAATRVDGDSLILSHRPGLLMQPGIWYESRKAVFGIAQKGHEKREFKQYIAACRPRPRGLHFNYNSWWTSPTPFSENDILHLMKTFEEKLHKPYGVHFDTFCIDLGWANPQSIWEIGDKLFPRGFVQIQEAANEISSDLGLWISPDGRYRSLDPNWAMEHGYEAFNSDGSHQLLCCLGGERYASRFRERLVDLVKRFGIRQIKFDGFWGECPHSEHGHEPGPLSREAVAEGLIAAFEAIREASPDTWLQPTCFGYNPSPWWLLYVDSVTGTYGDDSPRGRVPAPVYRESNTTARDYFNLQGAEMLPVPIVAQEVLSVVHQTRDPFLNDVVTGVMRGNAFISIYLNPRCVDDTRWKALAGVMEWGRENASILEETQPLLPASWRDGKHPQFTDKVLMPREPYGYAHWRGAVGLVEIRNPWIEPTTFSLVLDESAGLLSGVRGLTAVSLYPEARLYGRKLCSGDTLSVPLAPYETVVLSIGPEQSVTGLPGISEAIGNQVKATVLKREATREEFDNVRSNPLDSDWTSLVGDNASAIRLSMEADVSVAAPRAQFLVLLEGDTKSPTPVEPKCRLVVNGKEVLLEVNASDVGWGQRCDNLHEHWVFLQAPLPQGDSRVDLEVLSACDQLSVWVWAAKPGGAGPTYPNAIPSPELISLDAAQLGKTVVASALSNVERMWWPVEKIEGVFLDAMDPVSEQPRRLHKNQNIGAMPLTIAGKRYLRGLGTHSNSRVVYSLDGKYSRFQSRAGVDITADVATTFSVQVDGEKRWESGLMNRADAAALVDIDVAGAQTLELIAASGVPRRRYGGGPEDQPDKANWAEARLLR